MPTTDQLQAEINAANGIITGLGVKITVLQQQVVSLQQRCSRIEAQNTDLKKQVDRVKKG